MATSTVEKAKGQTKSEKQDKVVMGIARQDNLC